MKRFQSRAVDGTNKLISGATISVFLTGTGTFAPLFSGEGLSALANPFASDHLGVFEFYAESKDYDIDVKDPLTGASRKYSDISHFDVRDVAVLKSGDSMQGQLRLQSGSVSEPGLGFVGDTDTGFNRPGADIIGAVVGGAERARFIVGGSGVQLQTDATAALQAVPKQHLDALTSGDMAGNARVGVRVQSAGSTFKRRRLNLISGGNISLVVADDVGNDEVDVTIDLPTVLRRISLPLRKGALGAQAFWPDAESKVASFGFVVPGDYVSGDLEVRFLRRASVAVGTAVMSWSVFRFRDGAAFNQFETNAGMNFVPGDTNDHLASVSLAAVNFQPKDTIGIDVERSGGDANDTLAGFVDYDGGWIEYTGRG